MPRKKYLINLSDEDRETLLQMTPKGVLKARKFNRALILLKADEGLTELNSIDFSGTIQFLTPAL